MFRLKFAVPLLLSTLLAGCVDLPKGVDEVKGKEKIAQTIVLKEPAHLKLFDDWNKQYYRITEVSGKYANKLDANNGVLWIAVLEKTGLVSTGFKAFRWSEVGQYKRSRKEYEPYFLILKNDMDAKRTAMSSYRSVFFMVCEEGADPNAAVNRCMEAKDLKVSMFHSSETEKPSSAQVSKPMAFFNYDLGLNAVNPVTASEYDEELQKWTKRNERWEQAKKDEVKRAQEEAQRIATAEQNFLTKSKKGSYESCSSSFLLGLNEPVSSSTVFKCAGSGIRSLSELQSNGWRITSTTRERMQNTYGASGVSAMISLEKIR